MTTTTTTRTTVEATTEPTTTEMLRELMREVADYGRDLARLAGAEWKEKSHSLRTLAMAAGAAALVLFTSFMLLTVALVGAIAYGLDSWRWALLIVGVCYGIIGLLSLIPVSHALRSGLFQFSHTRERVRVDAEWVKHKLAA
ncbi:MAG TPA: phage holin family protein [Terriglobales bacterium]